MAWSSCRRAVGNHPLWSSELPHVPLLLSAAAPQSSRSTDTTEPPTPYEKHWSPVKYGAGEQLQYLMRGTLIRRNPRVSVRLCVAVGHYLRARSACRLVPACLQCNRRAGPSQTITSETSYHWGIICRYYLT